MGWQNAHVDAQGRVYGGEDCGYQEVGIESSFLVVQNRVIGQLVRCSEYLE